MTKLTTLYDTTNWQYGDWATLSTPNSKVEVCEQIKAVDAVRNGHLIAEPIILTEGILKANGWDSNYGILCLKGKPIRLGWEPKNKKFYLCFGELPYQVRYVHQVQHILRVCGMDNEADSFKIHSNEQI